jgi:hypothetical protein
MQRDRSSPQRIRDDILYGILVRIVGETYRQDGQGSSSYLCKFYKGNRTNRYATKKTTTVVSKNERKNKHKAHSLNA